jgi:hypothetical protein
MSTPIIPKRTAARSPGAFDDATPFPIANYLWERQEGAYRPEAEARLYYTEEGLHLRFRVYEADPKAEFRRRNDPVYRDSCVECFLQPMPESDPRYFNFEFNAAGVLFLGFGSDRDRGFPPEPEALFAIEARPGFPWELEFTIPFRFIRSYFPDFRPTTGGALRANFYKCGDDTDAPHYASWHPVRSAEPDFHRVADFGTLRLG